MKIIIPGEPIAKARPRFFSKGGRKLAYNSQAELESTTKVYLKRGALESKIALYLESDVIAYSVDLKFYCRPPPGKDANLKLWGIIPHILRFDVDNAIKYYLDCGNGILWHDDRQIDKITASKHYSTNPRTEIDIMAKKIEEPMDDVAKIMKAFNPDEYREFMKKLIDLSIVHDALIVPKEEAAVLIEFAKKYAKKLSEIAK